jgi:hypothetical protein
MKARLQSKRLLRASNQALSNGTPHGSSRVTPLTTVAFEEATMASRSLSQSVHHPLSSEQQFTPEFPRSAARTQMSKPARLKNIVTGVDLKSLACMLIKASPAKRIPDRN